MSSSRRSHKKSRTGCRNCKRRKVKCDEAVPCTNCVKHSIVCDLTTNTIRSTPTTQQGRNVLFLPAREALGGVPVTPISDYQLATTSITPNLDLFTDSHLLDLELLHHWSTSAYATLTHNPTARDLYRITFPKLAFKHPFVLRAMLALSALHLAHFRPEQRSFYTQQALQYHSLASREATRLLPNSITPENATALFGFSMLTCFYLLASPARDNRGCLIPEDETQDGAAVEWLLFFRGIRSLLSQNMEALDNGELSMVFSSGAARVETWLEATQENSRLSELERLFAQMKSKLLQQSDEEGGREKVEAYEKVICYLRQTFNELENASSDYQGRDVSDVFRWAALAPEKYLQALFDREPLALVVFGWYCVVLKELEGFWWMQGWTRHHISRVWSLLTEEYRLWIRWPIEEIGWVPPG